MTQNLIPVITGTKEEIGCTKTLTNLELNNISPEFVVGVEFLSQRRAEVKTLEF